ncbi:ATP-dependent zinc metalloprotease YME1 -like protein [Halotydeus destructor]|nr:ATP-dependent zinc metalloprotease YME1 -like protein [Halotydeus destructor]
MITCTFFELQPQYIVQPVYQVLFGRGRVLHGNANGRRSHSKKASSVLCPESFESALKSSVEVFGCSEKELFSLKEAVRSWKIHHSHVDRHEGSVARLVSHRSSWSFETNKLLASVSQPASFIQYRTFKTRREGGGIHRKGSNGESSESESWLLGQLNLGDSSGTANKKEKQAKKAATTAGDLKELLKDESVAERLKLKLAFAEGYLHAQPQEKKSTKLKLFNIFRDVLGVVLILVVLFSFMGELSGGPFKRVFIGGGNEVHPEEIDVTFEDVMGVEEAKQELQEVVEFLKNPDKFSALGGKLPKGVLLVGPPGTGKTLLARAVAGEAGVPFFHAAGPEFDEILVGQGARRVRDLFSTAKLKAPCVIFIDEIDSVGAKRTNSVLHPYANQTINQLLTEMDGFRQNEGVIVLGATNRRDDLDKALLRPGRFDVEVTVPVPDLKGRTQIFDLYLSKVKTGSDVTSELLAKRTTGFTGADIENMVNQAALRAAIEGAADVRMSFLENARDKLIMGPERKSRLPDEESNRITAYHEAGHTLVALKTKDATPLHKVTIVSRGQSLGHTAFVPDKENYHYTKSQMLAELDSLMGGRVAEEVTFGLEKITSGASSDLQRATQLATIMVKAYGMSEKVGMRTFDEDRNGLVVVSDLSASTTEAIDSEIKRLLQESYERARNILKTNSRELKLIAEALLSHETLDADEVKQILEGKEISKRLR